MWVCVILSRCVVENLYFWYCVEVVIVCHEGTAALADVTDLDVDIPQEGAAFQSSHDHDCFPVQFDQIEFHGEPLMYGVGAHFFV